MINEEIFELIGLGKNDGKICLALISEGHQRINELEKKTGLHRRTINDCVSRLESKGYVLSFLKNGKRYWRVTDVNRIISEMKEKEKEINETIPKLLKVKSEQESSEISIFTGEDAIKLMMEDELRSDEPTYVICSREFEERFWEYAEKQMYKRIFFGKPGYLIYQEKDREISKKAKKLASVEMNMRFVPEKYRTNVGFEICGDSLYIQTKKDIIKIKNQEVVNGLRKYFDLLWSIGKK